MDAVSGGGAAVRIKRPGGGEAFSLLAKRKITSNCMKGVNYVKSIIPEYKNWKCDADFKHLLTGPEPSDPATEPKS